MATDRSTPFAQILRWRRLAAGLSQEELAERAGLSVRGVSDLERGRRANPHHQTVRMLAEALALAPDDRAALIAAAHPEVAEPTSPPSAPTAPPPGSSPELHPMPLDLAPLPIPPTRLVGREAA